MLSEDRVRRPLKGPTWTQRDAADRKKMWEEWRREVRLRMLAHAPLHKRRAHIDSCDAQVRNLEDFKQHCKDKKKPPHKWDDRVPPCTWLPPAHARCARVNLRVHAFAGA